MIIATPSSSQGYQSKLRGPKKSLFERSRGVSRDEWPPIAVVVQSSNRFCHLTIFGFFECEWMNVMLILYERRFSWFSNINVLVYQ